MAHRTTKLPKTLPESLKFGGFIILGTNLQAVINGVAFARGETHRIRLRDKTVSVHCHAVQQEEVVLDVDGVPSPITLKQGEEMSVP